MSPNVTKFFQQLIHKVNCLGINIYLISTCINIYLIDLFYLFNCLGINGNKYKRFTENSNKITEAHKWYQEATIKISPQIDKYNWRYHNKQKYKQYKAYIKREFINEACDPQNS
jgi:hypothetical protein